MHKEDKNPDNVLGEENSVDGKEGNKTWVRTGTYFTMINLLYLLNFLLYELTRQSTYFLKPQSCKRRGQSFRGRKPKLRLLFLDMLTLRLLDNQKVMSGCHWSYKFGSQEKSLSKQYKCGIIQQIDDV